MNPTDRTHRPHKSNSRLTWLLAARMIPLFLFASAAMALLAYYLLSKTIKWRHQEAVRSAAIVCAEFLGSRVAPNGLTEVQKGDLNSASMRSGVRLLLAAGGSPPFDTGASHHGEVVSHRETFFGTDGKTEFVLEAQTPQQAMRDELDHWQRILTGFCIAATVFGAGLAFSFAMLVNRAKRQLIATVTSIGRKPPPPISTRMTEFAGLNEALFGLHASLDHRQSLLSQFEKADFSNPAESEGAALRSASGSVTGLTGAPFHISTGSGGAAGVALDQTQATIAAAKLGRQICLPLGPQKEALEAMASELPDLEAVILDGARKQRWRLQDGRVTSESWHPIGIVAPGDRIAAEWTSEQISGFEAMANPAAAIRSLSGFLPGPAGIVAVAEKQTHTT
jgi:hypothetical protein